MGEYLDDDESFSGNGTHRPAAPEFKSCASVVYLGQEGNETHLGYVVAVHGDGKGGPHYYTAYLEELEEKQAEGQRLFPVDTQEEYPSPMPAPVSSHSSSRASQATKYKKEKK
jgi:hypothetical protein